MKYSAFWKEGQTINEDIVKKEPIKRRLKFFYLLNKILSFDKGLAFIENVIVSNFESRFMLFYLPVLEILPEALSIVITSPATIFSLVMDSIILFPRS